MLPSCPLPSTRAGTFLLAAILWAGLSVYFARLTMGTHGSRSTTALTTGNGINALIATPNGNLFAGSYGDGVFRSNNNGDHWIQVNNGLTTLFVLSFATNASGDIFAGTYFGNGVFRSTDDGDSWNEKNDGLIATEVRTIVTQGPIPRMHSPNIDAADFIFAGTYGRGVFRSTDSGQNWQQTNNGLLALYESALAINTNGNIFVGADFVGGAGGVYRSADYGDSWVEINHDVIQTDVRALATNASGHILQEHILAASFSAPLTTATVGRLPI